MLWLHPNTVFMRGVVKIEWGGAQRRLKSSPQGRFFCGGGIQSSTGQVYPAAQPRTALQPEVSSCGRNMKDASFLKIPCKTAIWVLRVWSFPRFCCGINTFPAYAQRRGATCRSECAVLKLFLLQTKRRFGFAQPFIQL